MRRLNREFTIDTEIESANTNTNVLADNRSEFHVNQDIVITPFTWNDCSVKVSNFNLFS
jgi:hypothetical protein